jgi:hypothetical protein
LRVILFDIVQASYRIAGIIDEKQLHLSISARGRGSPSSKRRVASTTSLRESQVISSIAPFTTSSSTSPLAHSLSLRERDSVVNE